MRKIIAAIIIVFALIVVGVTGLIIKNNKSESDITVLKDNKEIKSFEVQYKNDNVKITDSDTVKAMTELLDVKARRDKKSDGRKGWIYRIDAYDNDGKAITSVTVISNTMIRIGEKVYTCDKIDISKLEELTGIDREK